MTVFFEDALNVAIHYAKSYVASEHCDLTLLRDLHGKIRLAALDNSAESEAARGLANVLAASLGPYAYPADQTWLAPGPLGDEMLRDRVRIDGVGSQHIWLLDRVVVGAGWDRAKGPAPHRPRRLAMFSIKGGVGRTTTTSFLAWHLAQKGKQVLVIDLDLESPGVGSMLLPDERMPAFGVVDWFVEDGVGQSKVVLADMLASSPLAADLEGGIRVVPAYGKATQDYLGKLGRTYLARNGEGPKRWPDRLGQMVVDLEVLAKPDVVLLDCRAGLHDIGAAVLGQLADDVLLFAVDTPQTWAGYSFLFHHWNQCGAARDIRDRLWMIAAMVPEKGRPEYRQSFREHAWKLFTDHLYDEAPPGADDPFSFDLDDPDAPHADRPVFWSTAVQGLDPRLEPDAQAVRWAYGEVLDWLAGLCEPAEVSDG